jgi:hypothetical protein
MQRDAGDLEAAFASSEEANALLAKVGAELGDRIVIAGTHALVLESLGRREQAASATKKLSERLRVESARIKSPLLRLRHQRTAQRLVEAVLSPEGPVYPRARLEADAS